VTIYERRQPGGALLEASVPEFKSDLRRLLDYFTAQIEKLNIRVISKEATPDTIRNGGYEATIIAAGGTPIKLAAPGAERPMVTGALEVLSGKAHVGQKVIIVGGGIVGTETGLFLAEQGKEIIFVEVTDEFMKDVLPLDRDVYQEKLNEYKVTVHTGKQVETITDRGAVIIDNRGGSEEITADNIVIAIGFAPQTALVQEFKKEAGIKVFAVGDCVSPRNIFDAIHDGYIAAYSLI
jgi:pyruvate/2-oxoglutarate dehydrogenase complex dihydrolipoamide dehydrogenase (E3) component